MLFIGPGSSLYDFLTFYVLLHVFHASEKLFHTGWFVESLATQALVVFVISHRQKPFEEPPESRADRDDPWRRRPWRRNSVKLLWKVARIHAVAARLFCVSRRRYPDLFGFGGGRQTASFAECVHLNSVSVFSRRSNEVP
jgi:hypothetical protein